ncbi:leukocyte immunoglobulin-like receptor subfamily B member 5 isoform X2 [Camelus ferus]|uniref:Leukocyte immunoglobulin-like receptor subfamily B member 5 isoform X2 n=2 Tax=Camelus TaxID=9836 RepID=A0A8B7KDI2_CAMFR|nr:leukocyte immunoglobulin-like receptor subfamily B member 5 isoform X2 [Camelus bactrianus]XP_014419016.1 leukocyte immunoglobulin-like receptor subfamily B member 5 isoform X2 [Camelus ferus]
MAPGVVLMLGLAFCLDQRIWAQTDLPEIYRDPPENGSLPIVIGTSVISVLPLLFLLLFLLCWCWCQAKHKAVDSETKSQGTYDSTSPGMDFPEETQCEVSVDTRPEEDRQMDTQAPTEQGKQEVISAQLHQDSCAENVDPPFSGALEEPPR